MVRSGGAGSLFGSRSGSNAISPAFSASLQIDVATPTVRSRKILRIRCGKVTVGSPILAKGRLIGMVGPLLTVDQLGDLL